MKEVFVVGAGGHAKVSIDILQSSGYTVVGIVDDNPSMLGKTVSGVQVIGQSSILEELYRSGLKEAFIAIGNNQIRMKIAEKMERMGFSFVKAIHPRSIVASSVQVGDGSLVAAGAVLNPDSCIGKQVIVNTGATVDHDCMVEEGAHIAPGSHLAGQVFIGKRTHIGIGTSVIQGIHIGEDSIVGAGSVVVRSLPAKVKAYGVPARIVETLI
ncbi:hexapeptide transferase [Collibacillus ludicampi]|uniref:Hexapeptide transferase n=1 Tax=Collibacillus ludicampi TaxID=2771369 RepID=A0AAV4LCJ5_9BACL|nr:acetyltransferase [Collibacillus ludicampi]GIM45488.1 hexapeptide transferase [Collibacillus ludicampi]